MLQKGKSKSPNNTKMMPNYSKIIWIFFFILIKQQIKWSYPHPPFIFKPTFPINIYSHLNYGAMAYKVGSSNQQKYLLFCFNNFNLSFWWHTEIFRHKYSDIMKNNSWCLENCLATCLNFRTPLQFEFFISSPFKVNAKISRSSLEIGHLITNISNS